MKYRLGLYEKAMPDSLSLTQKLMVAKNAGYDYVEISIDESDKKLSRLDEGPIFYRNLSSFMSENEFRFESMCLSALRKYAIGSSDPYIAQKGLETIEKAVYFAARLGIRIIMLAGYDVYYEKSTEKTKERFLKNLEKAVNHASSYGVTLSFETMETPFMDTVEKAMHYVNLIGSPYLQVYPDIGNITNANLIYGVDNGEDLEKGAGHLAAMHLKETKPGIYRNMIYGTGHVNFDKALEKAYKLKICRFTNEFWFLGSPAWETEIAKARFFMHKHLIEAGYAHDNNREVI